MASVYLRSPFSWFILSIHFFNGIMGLFFNFESQKVQVQFERMMCINKGVEYFFLPLLERSLPGAVRLHLPFLTAPK